MSKNLHTKITNFHEEMSTTASESYLTETRG